MEPEAARMASSIPEQAIDARRAAVEEVEKLLQHPEDLKRLPDMLEEYMLKVQVQGPGRAQASANVTQAALLAAGALCNALQAMRARRLTRRS